MHNCGGGWVSLSRSIIQHSQGFYKLGKSDIFAQY